MTRAAIAGTVAGVLAMALLAGALPGQGRGMGWGRGQGMGMGRGAGAGWCMGLGPGAGAGGWWTRVTPQTPEQRAFVDQVARLHNEIRAANLAALALQAQDASQDRLAPKLQEVAALRARLAKISRSNSALLQQMGVPAGYGICDGTGPRPGCPMAGFGRGRGMGGGMGRGYGMGLRNGTGPNPNCPLK